jgi:sugar lactone lactonase YvrE
MIIGEGEFRFEYAEGWGQLPEGWRLGDDTPGVATDSQDRVYVFNRSEHPMIVFDRAGSFLGSWGEGIFTRPHGVTITPEDVAYCTDDHDHTVRKFTAEGKLLQTLGVRNQPSDTGYDMKAQHPLSTIKRGAGPFNRPTKVAVATNGDLYITDGYGNARVHRFTVAGELVQSWGEPGEAPRQFNLPHCVWIHTDGRLFVCDRENSRVQIFSPTGERLGGFAVAGRPQELRIDAENRVWMSVLNTVKGGRTMAGTEMTETVPAHVCVCDLAGNLLAWLGGTNPGEMDSFVSSHGFCLDSRGDLYVVENGKTALARIGINRPDYPSLRKFVRV